MVYGVLAVATGIMDIVFYARVERHTGFGPMTALVSGILSVMCGFMLLVYPSAGQWAMTLLFPLWFLTHCISNLTHLNWVRLTAGRVNYTISLILNILGIVLATLMLLHPVLSAVSMSLTIYWVGAAIVNRVPAVDLAGRISTFGDIVVFGTYATYIIMSLMMLVMILVLLPMAQVSAVRINEVLDAPISLHEGKMTEAPEQGTVEFRDVSFRYPSSSGDVLEHVSFRANKGETVAFIGATGSGKTTLVSLAARFYDATEGQVLIDGQDVRSYSFDALYDRIGYVTQRAIVFAGDVRSNVLFGESGAPQDDESVQRALSLAQATEFVDKLPGKLDAPIAQAGANVSGGQKQRLSIARALARKPEILIFDDSFSALDYRTDASLRAGLARELSDTTCLIVAQRIGTIRHADRIVVLDEGRVAGIGTHDELMKNCGVYREIAMSQLSAAELEKEGV